MRARRRIPTLHRGPRSALLLLVLVVAVGTGVAALVLRDGRDVAERRAVGAECGGSEPHATVPSRNPDVETWGEATRRVSWFCPGAGPGLTRADFADQAGLRAALLRAPPPSPLCLAGNTVLLDALDEGFGTLCRRLGGVAIDGARRLPEPTGLTMDEIDRNGRAWDRRASALQRRALVAHWARHPGA